jgi:serine/threonine-protein kinase
MPALLRELARDPARTWRRVAFGAAVAGAAVAALLLVRAPARPSCSGGEEKYAAVWGPEPRAAARATLVATGRSHAPATFDRVAAALDRHAAAWSAARVDACEATFVRGDQSPALLDARMRCLDRRLAGVAAVLEALKTGGAQGADKAVDSIASATADLCKDADALEPKVPMPADPAARARIDELEGRLAGINALVETGQCDAALARIEPLLDGVRATGYPPLLTRALLLLGKAQQDAKKMGDAEATYRALTRAAASAGDDKVAAQAWTSLIFVLADGNQRVGDALALQTAAEAAVARIGDDPAARSRLANALGIAYRQKGMIDESRRQYELSIQLAEKELGPGSPVVAVGLNNLGVLLFRNGDFAGAERAQRRSIDIRVAYYGPDHPLLGSNHSNLGNVYTKTQRWDEALDEFERALTIFRATLRPDHPRIAETLANMGSMMLDKGDLDRASQYQAEALAIMQKSLGDDHPNVAAMRIAAGQVAIERHRYADALPLCSRGRQAMEDRGLRTEGVVDALLCEGDAEEGIGKHRDAIDTFERALELGRDIKLAPESLARVELTLADALWRSGRDRGRAVKLAESAREGANEKDRATAESLLTSWKRRP